MFLSSVLLKYVFMFDAFKIIEKTNVKIQIIIIMNTILTKTLLIHSVFFINNTYKSMW